MFEIEWKNKVSVYRNLLQIKGISHTLANKICALLGISTNTIYSNLAPHKIDKLNTWISFFRKKSTPINLGQLDPSGITEGSYVNKNEKITFGPILENLEEFKKENIKILISLNALRGRRYKQGYPVRGQRTRSNAITAKKLNRVII